MLFSLSLVTNLQFCARASSFWTICVCSKLSPWWWAQWWTVPGPPWKVKHTKPYSNERPINLIYKATRLLYIFLDLLLNDTDNCFCPVQECFTPVGTSPYCWRRKLSALIAFEPWGIFIVADLLWHGTSLYTVSSEGPPRSVASYDKSGIITRILIGLYMWAAKLHVVTVHFLGPHLLT